MNKNINYYLQLGYPVIIRPYIDRGKKRYLAEYPDLPGCSSHGESPAKAHKMAEKAMKLWLETCIKEGIKIPEPRFIEDFSGRFVLRPSKSLHYQLSNLAKKENTSLNQLTLQLVEKGLGKKEIEGELKKEIRDLGVILRNMEARLKQLEATRSVMELIKLTGEQRPWNLSTIRPLASFRIVTSKDVEGMVEEMAGEIT